MNDEHQPASGPVVAIEAVAIRVSYLDGEQPPRTQDPQGGFVEFEPVSSAGMKSYPEALPGIVQQSMLPEQRELAAGEKWEIRPPDDQERLSTLVPRERD